MDVGRRIKESLAVLFLEMKDGVLPLKKKKYCECKTKDHQSIEENHIITQPS